MADNVFGVEPDVDYGDDGGQFQAYEVDPGQEQEMTVDDVIEDLRDEYGEVDENRLAAVLGGADNIVRHAEAAEDQRQQAEYAELDQAAAALEQAYPFLQDGGGVQAAFEARCEELGIHPSEENFDVWIHNPDEVVAGVVALGDFPRMHLTKQAQGPGADFWLGGSGGGVS
jgi:hypothetical protein